MNTSARSSATAKLSRMVSQVEAWYLGHDGIKSGLGRLVPLLCWLEAEGRIGLDGTTVEVDLDGLRLVKSSDPEWSSRAVREEDEKRSLRLGASVIDGKRCWLFVVGERRKEDDHAESDP